MTDGKMRRGTPWMKHAGNPVRALCVPPPRVGWSNRMRLGAFGQ